MLKEFDLIKKYFKKKTPNIPLGIGDDGALIEKNKQTYFIFSQDTLNINTHFFKEHDPRKLGWKTLAVNISDILAMGGLPKYALLSVALKKNDDRWLTEFSKGFFDCAKKYNVDLIGGDTTKGELSLSVTIIGEVKQNFVLRRDGACINEDIWVTGEIGHAAIGLAHQKKQICLNGQDLKKALSIFEQPKPIQLDMKRISPFFSSAIDISDGLAQDLKHILNQSKVGAKVYSQHIPVAPWIMKNNAYDFALYGGEDYQLILTSPKKNRKKIYEFAKKNKIKISKIGVTEDIKGLQLFDENNNLIKRQKKGFSHFA